MANNASAPAGKEGIAALPHTEAHYFNRYANHQASIARSTC